MNFLDVRTVMFSHIVTDAVCTVVLAFLWAQNRKRFAGIAFWLSDLAFQTVAASLIVLRGSIPDWISMLFSNTLVIAGALLGYMGLARFVGKKSSQIHNYILLAAFVAAHSYFVFVRPNLAARNLNVSLGLLIVCFQCVWLALRRTERGMRRMAREVGLVFGIFCLVSLVRIVIVLTSPQPSNDFFRSGLYDTLLLVSYQVLLILLAFALTLMVNRRLLVQVQSQEEKFFKAFRSSPYALTLTRSSDGQMLEVNEGFVAISGYSYDEAVGKTTLDLQLWAREEDRVAVASELSRGNRVMGKEFQFRTKSGDLITGLFSAEIIMIDDQPWVLSSISDISARARAEAARRQAEAEIEHLASFPRLNPHPILEVDASGAIQFCNPATMEVLSRLGLGDGARIFCPPDMADILQGLAQQKESLFYRDVTVHGAVFGESIHLVPELNVARIYASDISERKRAEGKLAQTLERLNLATRAARLGIWDWDIQKNELVWDERMYELYGIRKEDFGGAYEAWLNGLHPDDRAMSDEISRQAQRGEREYDTEFRVIWPDGSVHYLKAEGQFVRSADGTPLRLTGVNYDITERKQAEEAISAYSEKLEQMVAERTRSLEEAQEKLIRQEKLAVLGQLSGSVAHELRTPLGAIKSAVYLLDMILENPDSSVQETLDILDQEIAASEQIINNLLDFARTRQPVRQPIDVNQAVHQALSRMDVPDGVSVQQDLADLPPVAADPDQMGQILGNLILNAIQAMPHGGRLTIETSKVSGEPLKSGGVAISIADTGIGIPPENLARLFEPLFTTKPKGIGLGLPLVKMLVEGHGGAVRVESAVGRGSTFVVELPMDGQNRHDR